MKTEKTLLTLLIFGLTATFCCAQELPPIFKDTPKQLMNSKTLVSFPKKTFLENLILLPDGSILVNSHYEGVVYKIDSKGLASKYVSVKGKVTGIAAYGPDKFVLTGNDEKDHAEVYLLDHGKINKLIDLPQGEFVNGITRLTGDNFLIADSYKGCIWKINAKSKTAEIWLTDELLKRSTEQNPTPAANGIKIYNHSVYVSNTQKQVLIKIKLYGEKPGKPEVWLSKVNFDDFIFDKAGNLYGATHVYNSVVKITPHKHETIIAEQPQGVSGSTACILKPQAKGYILYVSTNGGMYLPPPTGIEESKIVALTIN